jgi:hypothetical protein
MSSFDSAQDDGFILFLQGYHGRTVTGLFHGHGLTMTAEMRQTDRLHHIIFG